MSTLNTSYFNQNSVSLLKNIVLLNSDKNGNHEVAFYFTLVTSNITNNYMDKPLMQEVDFSFLNNVEILRLANMIVNGQLYIGYKIVNNSFDTLKQAMDKADISDNDKLECKTQFGNVLEENAMYPELIVLDEKHELEFNDLLNNNNHEQLLKIIMNTIFNNLFEIVINLADVNAKVIYEAKMPTVLWNKIAPHI